MIETDWFCGRGVMDGEARAGCSTFKKACLLVLVCVAAAVLVGMTGCAAVPEKKDDPYLRMVCAIVETGAATFENDPKRYPSMRMICEEEGK